MKWYKYDIRDLTDTEYNKWYSLMSEDKRHRVDRFRFLDDKKRTVAGEMLARGRFAGIDSWGRARVESCGAAGQAFLPEEASLRPCR